MARKPLILGWRQTVTHPFQSPSAMRVKEHCVISSTPTFPLRSHSRYHVPRRRCSSDFKPCQRPRLSVHVAAKLRLRGRGCGLYSFAYDTGKCLAPFTEVDSRPRLPDKHCQLSKVHGVRQDTAKQPEFRDGDDVTVPTIILLLLLVQDQEMTPGRARGPRVCYLRAPAFVSTG